MYVLSKSFKNFVNLVYEWFSFKIHAFHDPRNLWLNQVTKILSCVFFLKLYSVRRSCVCVSDPFESVHVHGLCRARLLLRVGTQLFLSLCLIWLLSLCGPLNLGWQWMCGWLYLLVYLYASTAAPGSLFWFPVTLAAPLWPLMPRRFVKWMSGRQSHPLKPRGELCVVPLSLLWAPSLSLTYFLFSSLWMTGRCGFYAGWRKCW